MSDYIEDRIKNLEQRLNYAITQIHRLEKTQEESVKALEEKSQTDQSTGVPLYTTEDRGIEIGFDQSTEEFVKVTRCKDCKLKGKWDCPFTFTVSGYGGYGVRIVDPSSDDDYCSRGEKR